MTKKKTEAAKRKRRQRKLDHTTPTIRARVLYICDYLFGGIVPLFAQTIDLDGAHLRLCLYHGSRFSPAMLAQIVSKTNIRAEWLLCGIGPMLAPDAPEGLETLVLPRTLGSAFSQFDTSTVPALPVPRAVAANSYDPGEVTPAAVAAARCVAAARGADKPVWLFAGKNALYAGARPVITSMLEKKYVTGVGLTAAAVELELPPSPLTDKSHTAKLGAQAGFGFGESLCRWGAPPATSVFVSAQRCNAPITVHAEFGEVCDHFRAGLHGAEMGAVLGAALYVDLLIFTESVRCFAGTPGGVCIALGDGARFGNLFVQALQTSQQAGNGPYRDFSFVLVDRAPDASLEHLIGCNGGQFHFIQGDLASGADGLAKACDAVFDGTI